MRGKAERIARHGHSSDTFTVLSTLLLVQNLFAGHDVLGVLWTLPIEVQMYVTLPLCFLVARKGARGVIALIAAGMLAAFSIVGARYESLAPQWAFCLALGLVIPFVREFPRPAVARVAHEIATYSYGIYLLHEPSLWIAFRLFRGAPPIVQWLAFAFFACALPWAAYQLIERPGIRLGQRLVHQPMPAATPVGAP